MLTTSTSTAKPRHIQVFVIYKCLFFLIVIWRKYSNGYSAGMHSTTFFCRRDSLDTMTASFIEKLVKIGIAIAIGTDLKPAFRWANFSTETRSHARVSIRQCLDEQLGVITAFSGLNFDVESFHGFRLLSEQRESRP